MELDTISDLPSGVAQKILSFLPIREAVRTSVLSSNWRHKWAMVRHLVFDDQCVLRYRIGRVTRTKIFMNIVDHVLLLHSGPIDTFKLSSRNSLDSSCIDKWILHLLRNSNSIKEFILKPEGNRPPYNISSCLFFYPDLTHLELYNCSLKLPKTFKGFLRLKSLDIQKVIVARYVLEKVIVSCPLLERMSLWDLKRSTHLNIDAPNLQFLKVGGGFRGFKFKNTPNLVGLKVKNFHGVKAEVDLLKVLLLSCPALQELEILFGNKKNTMKLDDKQNCISTQLRVLKLTGFSGGEDEIDFIRFLLSSSPVLERITLQPSSAYVSWKLPKMLEDFEHLKKKFMDLPYSSFDYSSDED
ncbi:hypothetical protein M0R45_020917 [Rubus argutus]|uniref:F-box domain-containing protein n=1 Tax=Rubus argutus TaxID=59490 RepID=A0AAW1XBZ4_RUBAR